MRLTVPHLVEFDEEADVVGDDLLRPDAWDALRVQTAGAYSIPASRDEYEKRYEAEGVIRTRAGAITKWLDGASCERLASYGAGVAVLELALARLAPARHVIATDYAPETVSRLDALLTEVEIARHDLLADDPLDADIHLFHRIDTELSDDDWRAVFARFSARRVLVLPGGVISSRQAVSRLTSIRRRRSATTRAGWLRTASRLEELWADTHAHERSRFADVDGWILRPRAEGA